jgi:hypothetical protein
MWCKSKNKMFVFEPIRGILTEGTIQRVFGADLRAHVIHEPAAGVVIYQKTNDN